MKKPLSLTLALLLMLSLCACGIDDTTAPTKPSTTPSVPSTPADPTTGDPDPKPEDEKRTVSILNEMVRSGLNEEGEYEVLRTVFEYDEQYRLTKETVYINDRLYYETTYAKDVNKPLISKDYYENGELSGYSEYTYDENGNLLCYQSNYSYDGEPLSTKRVCTYDEQGHMLTEQSYSNGVLDYESHYTYTDDGLLESETSYWCYGTGDLNGVTPTVTRYTYDEYGNLLSQKTDGAVSGSMCMYVNTYNEKGALVEVKGYVSGKLYDKTCYDADGNETLWVGYNTDDGKEWRRVESTFEHDRLLSKVTYSDDMLDSTELYTYNEKDLCVKYSYSNSIGCRYYYTYEHNELGDVVKVDYFESDEKTTEITLTFEAVAVSREIAEGLQAVFDEYDLK